jgi:hypothetical protein
VRAIAEVFSAFWQTWFWSFDPGDSGGFKRKIKVGNAAKIADKISFDSRRTMSTLLPLPLKSCWKKSSDCSQKL